MSTIPQGLREWAHWAQRLGTDRLYFVADFKGAAAAIDDSVLEELARFYRRAVAEGDLAKLNAWLGSLNHDSAQRESEAGIRNLVSLLPHIGRYTGLQPFLSNALTSFGLVPARPDWSRLPEPLAFLSGPAEEAAKYSYTASEEGREIVQATATEAERERFAAVAERVRNVGYKQVQQWSSAAGILEHREAYLVANLIGVLDALGLRYYD